MTALVLVALGLMLVGAFMNAPLILVIGLIVGALEAVHIVFARVGLVGVHYRRELAAQRVTWGNELEMKVEIWNRKRMPLAWVRAVDDVSVGVMVRRRPGASDESIALLTNTWTLAPFERVVRHVWLTANRRGVHAIGPTHLFVGDLLARDAASVHIEEVDHFTVWPRVVPAAGLARPDRWGDLQRAARGLIEDPARFYGVRPYSSGDPLRKIHGRTSARVGRPMTKRFEPSRERQLLVALDLQTSGGREWDITRSGDPGEIEALYVVAASLVRSLSRAGASVGLTAAGFTRTASRFADIDIGQGPHHADRILDMLARMSSYPSTSFNVLLARINRRFRSGTTVLVVTMRDPTLFSEDLHRLRRSGFGVVVLTCGVDAGHDARAAQRQGFPARAAVLDGPWQTATALVAA